MRFEERGRAEMRGKSIKLNTRRRYLKKGDDTKSCETTKLFVYLQSNSTIIIGEFN